MANCNNKPRCGKCAGPHLTENSVAITEDDDEDLKKVVVELIGVVKEMRGQLERLERRVELLG